MEAMAPSTAEVKELAMLLVECMRLGRNNLAALSERREQLPGLRR